MMHTCQLIYLAFLFHILPSVCNVNCNHDFGTKVIQNISNSYGSHSWEFIEDDQSFTLNLNALMSSQWTMVFAHLRVSFAPASLTCSLELHAKMFVTFAAMIMNFEVFHFLLKWKSSRQKKSDWNSGIGNKRNKCIKKFVSGCKKYSINFMEINKIK